MEVSLFFHTPLTVMVKAIRISHKSENLSDSDLSIPSDNLGIKDKKLIQKVALSFKHFSVTEHVSYNFVINNLPRYILQELVRHRIASYTVESTRYTLNKYDSLDSGSLLYIPEHMDEELRSESIKYLDQLRKIAKNKGLKNDELKMAIPENYLTNIFWTINVRSLINFFNLRESSAAHKDIRILASKVKKELPKEHLFLFE